MKQSTEEHKTRQMEAMHSMMWVLFWIVVVVVLGTISLWPVSFSAECETRNWEVLPGNLSWAGGVRMAPELAHCKVSGTFPTWMLAGVN